ncbi:efflux transporter outer membrane subunit [Suttonella ornithocola]|uniref:Probable efflux pump outer membrane protein ttgC n=1 Tax=Suttonella ornithocola TaxID=279832 RepID=A0A380MYK8_9GAMM|nr:efflux transporter outer membrane subunit [Suttonella ornithocola]SUO97660.1 Probable efflux pump outer membrane protein ttgC precursor [Suttonella ornithocola]
MKALKKFPLKVLPLAIFISACSFIPSYQQPEVALEQQWMKTALTEQKGQSVQELGWREFFRDPQLQALIASALQYNHDLKTAALNIEMAAEKYNISRSNEFPTAVISTNATRSRTGTANSPTGNALYSSAYRAAVGINAFELDFFGRVSALSESALNTYLQTQEAKDSVQLSIIQNVAQAYYNARISRALMDLSEKVLDARKESTQLARLQMRAGVINGLTLKGYENANETAKADYQAYRRNYEQAKNALSVLVGIPVSQLKLPPAIDLNKQFANVHLPAGIPSAILSSRPDIRSAEYALRAANANIGAAKAALFPSISLTDNAGYASSELNNLFKGPNSFWSLTPSITLPIFNRSQLNANVRISELQQKKAVEDYQKAVQNAFKEVADALVAYETYAEQYAATARAVKAQAEVVRLERMRFKAGVSNGLTLIDAERVGYKAEESLLALQLNLLQNMVRLYTTMSGGLEEYGLKINTL